MAGSVEPAARYRTYGLLWRIVRDGIGFLRLLGFRTRMLSIRDGFLARCSPLPLG